MIRNLTLALSIILFASGVFADSNSSSIKNYIDKLVQDSFAILKDDSLSMPEKMSKSEILISKNMDLNWMSRFVLGRHRRALSDEQIASFTSLYSEFVVKSYSSAIKNFKNQNIKINSQQKINSSDYAVKTQLVTPDLDPIRIDYLVRETSDGTFLVFDVVTEGVSLINSHQAEFSHTLSSENFDELVKDLKDKIKTVNERYKK
jgi:phospholipid transport system substrate-binding protein